MPIVFNTSTLAFDMIKRRGNATIMSNPGKGMAKIKKEMGNANSLRNSQPSNHQTVPASTIITLTNQRYGLALGDELFRYLDTRARPHK